VKTELAPATFRSCTRVELDIGPSQESVPEKVRVSVPAALTDALQIGLSDPLSNAMTKPDADAETPAALNVGVELINDARLAAIDTSESSATTE
jgi:hypothetical protein